MTWTVDVGGEQTTAVWNPPAAKDRAVPPVFVCAHGAGGQMNDRSMLAVRDTLTAEGLGVVRFNFLYRAKGSARPDPMPRLLACWSAVVDRVRRELNPDVLILGGRSMGGRAASMFVAGDLKQFQLVGHCLITLLAALLGSGLSGWFYRSNPELA